MKSMKCYIKCDEFFQIRHDSQKQTEDNRWPVGDTLGLGRAVAPVSLQKEKMSHRCRPPEGNKPATLAQCSTCNIIRVCRIVLFSHVKTYKKDLRSTVIVMMRI